MMMMMIKIFLSLNTRRKTQHYTYCGKA